jgi:predicted N-acyltransferase
VNDRQLTLRIFESFAKAAPLFDRLEGWADNPTVSPTWLSALEDTGCATAEHGWIPHHLGIFSGAAGDELLAFCPGYVKLNSEGEFIFDWGIARAAPKFGVHYHPKLLFAVPFTPATGPRLLFAKGADRTLARAAFAAALVTLASKLDLSSAHVLFLPGAEATELAARSGGGLMHRLSLQYHWENGGYSTFEDFLAGLPSKRRTQIRRERKAPAEQGVTIETLRGDALTPEIADVAYDLYLTTVDKFTWGRRYLNRAFFEAVMSSMRDRVELVAAKRDGQIIAGAFNLRGDTTLYGRYWGAFEELPFLHFNVCFYHSIERCIADRLRAFEPGAGGEHKRARGFVPTLTHSVHHIRDRRLSVAVADFFEREREVIEAEVRGDDAVG